MQKVIILGSGPAGFTAGLYLGRAGLSPIIISGNEIGGQITLTTDIENYPGFPDGIKGPELSALLKRQAEKWGSVIENDEVVAVDFAKRPFKIKTRRAEFEAESVIVATGASPKKLGVPGEKEFTGHGVSYCATCDAPFFKGKEVIVVGGGDTALGEAIVLSKFCTKITIVHRRDQFRGAYTMAERVKKNLNIQVVWNTVVTEIGGNGKVEWVKLKDVVTNNESQMATNGVFVFVGQSPNTEVFKGQLDMDDRGYIKVDWRKRTNIEGVFAGGESEDWYFKQVATAVGGGCKAAIEAERWLASQE